MCITIIKTTFEGVSLVELLFCLRNYIHRVYSLDVHKWCETVVSLEVFAVKFHLESALTLHWSRNTAFFGHPALDQRDISVHCL